MNQTRVPACVYEGEDMTWNEEVCVRCCLTLCQKVRKNASAGSALMPHVARHLPHTKSTRSWHYSFYVILIVCALRSQRTFQSNYRVITHSVQAKSHKWYPAAGQWAVLSSIRCGITTSLDSRGPPRNLPTIQTFLLQHIFPSRFGNPAIFN